MMSDSGSHSMKLSIYSVSNSSFMSSTGSNDHSSLQNHDLYMNNNYMEHNQVSYQQQHLPSSYTHLVHSGSYTNHTQPMPKHHQNYQSIESQHQYITHHVNATSQNAYEIFGDRHAHNYAMPMHNMHDSNHSMNEILDAHMMETRGNAIPSLVPTIPVVQMPPIQNVENPIQATSLLPPRVVNDWKTRFHKGEIGVAPPDEYEIIEKPTGPQFRSPLWTYGLLLRRRNSQEQKWFCLADDHCIQSMQFYTATRSNSKVIKHLTKVHGFQSSRPNDRPRGEKRKADMMTGFPSTIGDKILDNHQDSQLMPLPLLSGGSSEILGAGGSSSESRGETITREIMLKLVYQGTVESLSNVSIYETTSSQLFTKLILPSTTINASVAKNVIYEFYQFKSSIIRGEMVAIQAKNPLPYLYLFIEILPLSSDNDDSSSSLLNLHASYINMQGEARSYVLASKILAPQASRSSMRSDVLANWIRLVLVEYDCQLDKHVMSISASPTTTTSALMIDMADFVSKKLQVQWMTHIPISITAMLGEIFAHPTNPTSLDIRRILMLVVEVIQQCRDTFPELYANQFTQLMLRDVRLCLSSSSNPSRPVRLDQWKHFFLFINIAYRSLIPIQQSYSSMSHAVFPLTTGDVAADYLLERLAVMITPIESLVDVLITENHVSLLQFHYYLHLIKLAAVGSYESLPPTTTSTGAHVAEPARMRIKLFYDHLRSVSLQHINQLMLSQPLHSGHQGWSLGLSLPYTIAIHAAFYPPFMRSTELILSSELNHNLIWEFIKSLAVNVAMKHSDATIAIQIGELRAQTPTITTSSSEKESINNLIEKWHEEIKNHPSHPHHVNDDDDEDGSSSDEEDHSNYPGFLQAAFAGSTSSTSNSEYLRMQYEKMVLDEIKSYFNMNRLSSKDLSLPNISKWWMKSTSKCPQLALIAQAFYGMNCSGS
jgi:hypothetical protein